MFLNVLVSEFPVIAALCNETRLQYLSHRSSEDLAKLLSAVSTNKQSKVLKSEKSQAASRGVSSHILRHQIRRLQAKNVKGMSSR